MYNGIMAGHEYNQKIIAFIKEIQAQIGKEKFTYEAVHASDEMQAYEVRAFALADICKALDTDDKTVRDARLKPIYEPCMKSLTKNIPARRRSWRSACTRRRNMWCAAGCWTSRSVWMAADGPDAPACEQKSTLLPVYMVPDVYPRANTGTQRWQPWAGERPADARWHRR